jgi:predicted PurR-regulated permease PerM
MTQTREFRFWLVGLALFLIALYLLRGVLLPFVAGMAIAYLLDPVVDRLERWCRSRILATCIVTIAFVVVVVAVLMLLVPLIQSQVIGLVESLPNLIAALQARAAPLLVIVERYLSVEEMADLRAMLGGQIGGIVRWMGQALGSVVTSGLALVSILSLVFITPVVTFYLLRDWDRLVTSVDRWLPREHAEVIREQVRLIDRTLAGYARGQAMVCLFLAVFYGGLLTLAGLDFGLIVGLTAGVLSFIPYVGTITGFVASMGIAFAQFPDWGSILLVLAIFVAGQVIEGNVLTPKLVGERIGLHPVWVIFALLAGGALFGFVGVLLGLPIAAVIGVLARFGLQRYMASPFYRGGGHAAEAPPPVARRSGGVGDARPD